MEMSDSPADVERLKQELKMLHRNNEEKDRQLKERALDYARLSQAHDLLISQARLFKEQLIELNQQIFRLNHQLHSGVRSTTNPVTVNTEPETICDFHSKAGNAPQRLFPAQEHSKSAAVTERAVELRANHTPQSHNGLSKDTISRTMKRKRTVTRGTIMRGSGHVGQAKDSSALSSSFTPPESGGYAISEGREIFSTGRLPKHDSTPLTGHRTDGSLLDFRCASDPPRSYSTRDILGHIDPNNRVLSLDMPPRSAVQPPARRLHGRVSKGQLHSSDFKIRPDHPGDVTFAFQETVRGKRERRCLPGCHEPNCCGGTFEKIARIAGSSRNDRKGLANALRTNTTESNDDCLLKQYLGADAGKLDYMSNVEKEVLLEKARARDLSNRHGKHRNMHPRPASPPGFWRADMPSTQEDEKDRLEVEARETRKAEQRYLEALRPDGKYVMKAR